MTRGHTFTSRLWVGKKPIRCKADAVPVDFSIYDPPAVSTLTCGGLIAYLQKGISFRKVRRESNLNGHAIHDGPLIILN